MSMTVELEKLYDLHQKGALSVDEFNSAKIKLLNQSSGISGSTGGFIAGVAAKRLVNFIIGFVVLIVIGYISYYFFVIIPAQKQAESAYKAFQEKNDREFKEFGEMADRKMEDFRKKHGMK